MLDNKLFLRFCRERNVKESTRHGYLSALKHYTNFHNITIDELIAEAMEDEKKQIPLKERRLKRRLLSYRNFLFSNTGSPHTIKTYFTKVKTFYRHFEIEIPILPDAKYDKLYETNYLDLPTRENIRLACEKVTVDLRAIILFMSSSGTAKAETLSLTVEDFIDGCRDYHNGGSLREILSVLDGKDNIVPTFYLRRIKTDKFYYTFCSPEASSEIVTYLLTRPGLRLKDPLFDFTSSTLLSKFQDLNDSMGWGFKGKYRFFRAHTLRKFHASNIGLTSEYVDALQGRAKDEVHETYIKTNPKELKRIYMSAMKRVTVYNDSDKKSVNQEFTIIINVYINNGDVIHIT